MKQSSKKIEGLDLDDLERALNQSAAPRSASVADDPLAELARIVGQEQQAGSARSGRRDAFEDFLAQSSEALQPAKSSPAIEPLFPDALPRPAAERAPLPEQSAGVAAAPYVDPLEALLAQDLGLRDGLADMPPPPPVEIGRAAAEIEWLALEPAVAPDEVFAAPAGEQEPSGDDEVAIADAADADGLVDRAEPSAEAPIDAAPAEAPMAAASKPPFDDMLAEFEAAMRSAADEAVVAKAAGDAVSVEDRMIVPPPGDIIVSPPQVAAHPATAADVVSPQPSGLGTAALGAAAIVARRKPGRGMIMAGGVIAVAVIGLGGLAFIGGGKANRAPNGQVPVIEARTGVSKERPANPGGVDVPNQDKEILQPRGAEQSRASERVAPREEQPVDLTQAQRQAAAPSAPAVRQIPGVGPAIPSEPAPRPVASVPIVISGQPPAAPVAPIMPPVQGAPAATAPAPAAPAPVAPTAAARPSTTIVPASPPAAAAAPQQAAAQPPAEPRRVRSVPIRPENGEAAPQRAQAQPRVVPAAPAAAADPNAPLSITPQGSRTAQPQRQAAASPGVVPSSVPSLAEPAAADPAPTRTASTGSGFAVQLAAEGSEDAARAKFNRMRGQYGSVLGETSPSIRSAEVNGRSVYRVRVGNMSRDEAVSMCERLKASGGSCFVARN
jgi:hypothetical protein